MMKEHEAKSGWWPRGSRALTLGAAAFMLMAVNDDGGCGTGEAQRTGERAACQTRADCGGDPGVDCAGQWACVSGACSFECGSPEPPSDPPTDPPVVGCYWDGDCPDGEVCNAAEVCLPPPGCGPGQNCPAVCYGACVAAPPTGTACTSSADCGAGTYCTTEDGVCESNCPPGMACPAVCWGRCEPIATERVCWSDAECAWNERCDRDPCVYPEGANGDADRIACGGVCRPLDPDGQCQSDRDCPRDQYCGCGAPGLPNGLMPCYLQCLPREANCQSDRDCQAGQLCVNGLCQERREECRDANECPRGWSCQAICPDGSTGSDGATPSDERPGPDGQFMPPPPPECPRHCVPPSGETCGDTGQRCGPNERCETVCWSVCGDCDCWGDDCACPCWEECFSTCVPGQDPVTCSSDGECGPGHVCDFSHCGWNEAGESDPSGRPIMCLGECRPVSPPEYDCKEDAHCVAADGRQGRCEFQVCEAQAFAPCDPSGQSCDPRPPETICYGYCRYDEPAWCDPADANACPSGFTCQSDCDAWWPNGLIFCPTRCVPEASPTDCVVTGCSGQVCAAEEVMTTCEWRPWYACYSNARCGRDASGECAWQQSDAFLACMREQGAYGP